MNNQKEEFLQKLAALLAEYGATISFDVGKGSDTHGLYDEKMVIYRDEYEGAWLEVNGWSIDSSDIQKQQ